MIDDNNKPELEENIKASIYQTSMIAEACSYTVTAITNFIDTIIFSILRIYKSIRTFPIKIRKINLETDKLKSELDMERDNLEKYRQRKEQWDPLSDLIILLTIYHEKLKETEKFPDDSPLKKYFKNELDNQLIKEIKDYPDLQDSLIALQLSADTSDLDDIIHRLQDYRG